MPRRGGGRRTFKLITTKNEKTKKNQLFFSPASSQQALHKQKTKSIFYRSVFTTTYFFCQKNSFSVSARAKRRSTKEICLLVRPQNVKKEILEQCKAIIFSAPASPLLPSRHFIEMKPFVFRNFLRFGFSLLSRNLNFWHIYLVYRVCLLLSPPFFLLLPFCPILLLSFLPSARPFMISPFLLHSPFASNHPHRYTIFVLRSINICCYCWQMQTAILTLYWCFCSLLFWFSFSPFSPPRNVYHYMYDKKRFLALKLFVRWREWSIFVWDW